MTTTNEGAAPEPVRLVTRFAAVDPTGAQQLVALLRAPADEVAREPGLQDYDVCIDADDRSVVWVVERWASDEHARGHEAAVALRGGSDRVAALLRDGIETKHLPVLMTIAALPPEGTPS